MEADRNSVGTPEERMPYHYRGNLSATSGVAESWIDEYLYKAYIGRPLNDANAIRLKSPDFAMQLIEVLE